MLLRHKLTTASGCLESVAIPLLQSKYTMGVDKDSGIIEVITSTDSDFYILARNLIVSKVAIHYEMELIESGKPIS